MDDNVTDDIPPVEDVPVDTEKDVTTEDASNETTYMLVSCLHLYLCAFLPRLIFPSPKHCAEETEAEVGLSHSRL